MQLTEASLIIAFYNNLDYLRLVLAGAERQSFKNFEVIIVDNNSSQNETFKSNALK